MGWLSPVSAADMHDFGLCSWKFSFCHGFSATNIMLFRSLSPMCWTVLLRWMCLYRFGLYWDCAFPWRCCSKAKFLPSRCDSSSRTPLPFLPLSLLPWQHRHNIYFLTTKMAASNSISTRERPSVKDILQTPETNTAPSVSLTSVQRLRGNTKDERSKKGQTIKVNSHVQYKGRRDIYW